MSSYSGSYSTTYSSNNTGMDYATFRIVVTVIAVVVEFVLAAIVYGCIKCCCPTSLRKVRPGLVLSDDVRNARPTVQPVVIQNMMPPAERVQMSMAAEFQSPPPQYSTLKQPDQAGAQLPVGDHLIEVDGHQPLIESK